MVPLSQTPPLDPNSPKGKEAAERLTNTLADIKLAIAERKRDAQRHAEPERGAA